MSWAEITWEVIDPETPFTDDERARVERIRSVAPLAARWLDDFLVSARRRYFLTFSSHMRHMFLRAKTRQGLRNWWVREWRQRPCNVHEVTAMTLGVIEQILTLPEDRQCFGTDDRGRLGVWIEVTVEPIYLRPVAMTVRPLDGPACCPVSAYRLSFGTHNELPLRLKVEDGRFVARNPSDEFISGTGGPTPQP